VTRLILYWHKENQSLVTTTGGKPLFDKGFAPVPDSPGLGVELNEEVVCRRRAKGGVPWHWNVGLASPPLPAEVPSCR